MDILDLMVNVLNVPLIVKHVHRLLNVLHVTVEDTLMLIRNIVLPVVLLILIFIIDINADIVNMLFLVVINVMDQPQLVDNVKEIIN